jgi:uncharacterized SAM-binding protein YcdF (DUF218 family)
MKSNKLVRAILLAVGLLCLAYGVILRNYAYFSLLLLIWFILGAVFVLLSVKKIFNFVFSKKWVRIVALLCVAVVVILEGLMIANGLGKGPRGSCDYLVVLGASIVGEVPLETLQYRLDAACEYMTAHPETNAILSGGQCEEEIISEAEAMYRYLVSKGIDKARLIKEDQSADTYENMLYSLKLIGDDKDLTVCVVSSDFHILRAKMLALKLGWSVSGLGAKTYLPLIPYYHLREMLAILKDFVMH